MSRLASHIVAVSVCAFPIAYACSQLVVVPVGVARVEIDPSALSLAVGATRQLTVTVSDETGNLLIDRTVSWSSSDQSRVRVDGDGLIVGVAPGGAMIRASSEGRNAHANVSVLGSPTGPTGEIRLSDTFVSFLGSLGGANPTARTVWVTHSGGGSLTGMNATVRYYPPGATGWLSASLTSTTAPTTLTLTARIGTVGVGVHAATVELSAPAANAAQISVILTISNPAPAGPPSAPSDLNATARGNNRIDLDWRDNSSNETSFIAQRSPLASGAWASIATLPAGTTQYQNTGLRSDTRYWYRVRACNTAGCGTSTVVSERTR
jgi:hypothetical protein